MATVHAGGKALGVSGGWVAGSSLLKDYLINFARPFIYSTAPSPYLAVLLREAVHLHQTVGHDRATQVLNRAEYFKNTMSEFVNAEVIGPIIPIIIGEVERTVKVALHLQDRGWDVRAIRPPTVPQGQARLRLTIKWGNSDEQLQQFISHLFEVLAGK